MQPTFYKKQPKAGGLQPVGKSKMMVKGGEMKNQFSENLKKIRKEHNISQEQLADELGVSRQAISKWESAVAYPEMDKIIALCDKFNLDIDDLLHNDIKEVKGEEERKKRINSAFEDFLKFITNTINLFSNMSFKSKIKCLFEQLVIASVLLALSAVIYSVLVNLFGHIVQFLPNKLYYFITNLLDSIVIATLLIMSLIIITHIFKTRFLDYYEKVKNESSKEDLDSCDDSFNNNEEKSIDKENKILFKRNEKKIVIRDPKHGEYRFINALFKLIVGVIKFFSICFVFFVAFILICLFVLLVISFLFYKTGFFFIGLLLVILSSSVITAIILLLNLNFVFNRKNDKKKIIWGFIGSLIILGIGCGMIFIGTISFNIIKNDDSNIKVVTDEYEMENNLLISPYSDYEIEYVKTNDDNIKIEYYVCKYCEVSEHYLAGNDNYTIMDWVANFENLTVVKDFIKNVNEKKIVLIDNSISKIIVYTNQTNIDTLNKNMSDYLKNIEQEEGIIESYEKTINELEKLIEELQQSNYELQEKLNK